MLRVIDPADCDAGGVPLDWERCRGCLGDGRRSGPAHIDFVGGHSDERGPELTCGRCEGHGSLKAAALALFGPTCAHGVRLRGINRDHHAKYDPCPAPETARTRCSGCGHPMSEGTWEGEQPTNTLPAYLVAVERWLRENAEPGRRWAWTHYSPCDELCSHGGPGRCWYPGGEHGGNAHWDTYEDFRPDAREDTRANGFGSGEASWRPVDVRCLSWPHDLRPEKLAVLCLRCWAERPRADA